MSAEQGEMVKFRNVTKQPVTFPCGSDRKQFGSVLVHEAGVPVVRPLFRQVERVITVKPGEVVGIEVGYTVPRGGIKERASYFDECGLRGKLEMVEEAP